MDKRAPDNRSIGVFDSGMGGLTAVRRLHALMPKENIIYFGDTSRVPYGTRGRDTIVKYARQDVAFLRQFDLKAIVIACNTVSSVALDLLTEENNIPIIGTVEPACRRAMTMTQNGRVGVIGTAATMRSGAYEKYLHKKDGTLRLYTQACPLFVPLVENGRVHRGDIVIETVAAEYLAPLKEAGVDTLILGCTHYPLLEEVISDYMGPDVTLIAWARRPPTSPRPSSTRTTARAARGTMFRTTRPDSTALQDCSCRRTSRPTPDSSIFPGFD